MRNGLMALQDIQGIALRVLRNEWTVGQARIPSQKGSLSCSCSAARLFGCIFVEFPSSQKINLIEYTCLHRNKVYDLSRTFQTSSVIRGLCCLRSVSDYGYLRLKFREKCRTMTRSQSTTKDWSLFKTRSSRIVNYSVELRKLKTFVEQAKAGEEGFGTILEC